MKNFFWFLLISCIMSPVSLRADRYCSEDGIPGNDRCLDGYICGYYTDEYTDDFFGFESDDIACFTTSGGGGAYYRHGNLFIKDVAEIGVGESGDGPYSKKPVMPLTDAFIPLTIGLLCYAYIKKKRA